jgi:flagellar motor switch protein FliG
MAIVNKNENPSLSSNSRDRFIDGKSQVLALMQMLNSEEKQKIIKRIKIKNPQLALELMHEGISFQQLDRLSENDLHLLTQNISPSILGIALKSSNKSLQQRILRILPKHKAQEAFDLLTSPLSEENDKVLRAQKRVLSVLYELNQKKQISIYFE